MPTPPPPHRPAALAAALALAALSLAPGVAAAMLGLGGSRAGALLATGLAAAVVLGLLSRRLWIGLLLLSPWAVLAPLELWYLLNYGQPTDAHVLGIVAETDWHEAGSFVGAQALPLAAATLAALALAVAAVRAARRHGLQWRHRSRWWLWGAGLVGLLLPTLFEAATPDAAADGLRVEQLANGDEVAEDPLPPTLRELAQTWPGGVPLRVGEFLRYRHNLQAVSERLAGFRFGARAPAADGQREVHVLVIGETGRPDRWQIHGYGRPTTPRLAAEPDLVPLHDVISPWAWTRMSVPVILTRKPGTDRRPFFAERSLVAAFREAGYRTYWFSTQSPLGQHDSSIALHAHEAHELRFINPGDYKQQAALDGELLPLLRAALARDEPRQLIVLHTLGSHYNYSHRHPPDFERFRPSLADESAPDLHDRRQREAMGNAYDNSVAYTDHVLAEAIAALRASGARATLFYVADHGENLFDGDCGLSGHGRATERDFRVAAFHWHSEAWGRRHPERIERLRARQRAPLSTENVFHSLLDGADIRYPDERLSASLFHDSWTPRPRIVQTGLDFDRAVRDPVCLSLQPAPRSAP